MICNFKIGFIALNTVLMLSVCGMNIGAKPNAFCSESATPYVNSRNVSLGTLEEGVKQSEEQTNKTDLSDKQPVEIVIKEKDEDTNGLLMPDGITMKGMPCTQNILDKFGPGFTDLFMTYMSTVKGMPKEQFYKMLVTADMASTRDKKNGTVTIFDSSFGSKFWNIVNKIASYSNVGGMILTEAISVVFLFVSEKCTFDDVAGCSVPSYDSSGEVPTVWQILGSDDALKYFGTSAALVYNLADNISLKIQNYAKERYTQYALIDNVESYMSLVKNFRNDNGNVEVLSSESKFGDVKGINVSEDFFNEYGPLFTETTRDVLNEMHKEFMSISYVNEIKKDAEKKGILESVYKKMNVYRWISEILYPVSGLTTLIASCSLTVSLGAEDENVKWWSQCVSSIAIPAGVVFGKVAKFFENLSNSRAKDYMIYAYYKPATENAVNDVQGNNGNLIAMDENDVKSNAK